MMEAARASETSVNFYQTTWRKNPEDSHLRTHRRDNFKSYRVGGVHEAALFINCSNDILAEVVQSFVVLKSE
jgi:hypothetical protein